MAKKEGKKKFSEALQERVPHFAGGGLMGGISGFLTPQAQGDYSQAQLDKSNYGDTIGTAQQQALQGHGQFQNIQAQQQNLANALLAQSQGQGPNPAQAALNQATGQNVAQQAALMAGQRGASANPALMARQIAQMGAGVQQQAAGQSALQQAQQQLAAQNALANQQSVMGQQNIAQQQASQGLLGTAGQLQGQQNQNAISNLQQMQQLKAQQELANAGAMQETSGGILGGLGSAVTGFLGLAQGGPVPNLPPHLARAHSLYHGGPIDFRAGGHVPGQAETQGDSLKNDTVPAMLSPGEVVLPRSVTQDPNAEKKAAEFLKHLKDLKKTKGKK